MLKVTDAALKHLHNALIQAPSVEEGTSDCFRMIVQDDDRIGLAVQSPQSGDHTFERDGATVLALPEALSKKLSERVLDLGDEGQLVFLPRPN